MIHVNYNPMKFPKPPQDVTDKWGWYRFLNLVYGWENWLTVQEGPDGFRFVIYQAIG